MEEDLEAARRYRERAEDLRTIAMGTKDAIMRKTLLGLAQNYEQMAASLGRIDNADEVLRSSLDPRRVRPK